MAENNHHHSGGGAGNGFLLGALIGAGAVLLFTTKRGKRILRQVSEEGLDSLADKGLLDFFALDEEEEEDVYVEPEKRVASEKVPTATHKEDIKAEVSSAARKVVKTAGRRFFKGVQKKG